MSSKHPEVVFKTSSTRLQDVLNMSWRRFLQEDVLKTYAQEKYIRLDQDVLKTPWRRFLKTETKDVLNRKILRKSYACLGNLIKKQPEILIKLTVKYFSSNLKAYPFIVVGKLFCLKVSFTRQLNCQVKLFVFTRLQDVFTSHQDVFDTSSTRFWDVLGRLLSIEKIV